MGKGRPMVFVRTDKGCLICLTHKLNQDGYLRKNWRDPDGPIGSSLPEMFHRFIFRAHKGEIPEGFEVDHICNVRPCCNPDHLEAIPGDDHVDKTNRGRYSDRYEAARTHWLQTLCTGSELGERFGVTFSSGCRWIREWRSGNHSCQPTT